MDIKVTCKTNLKKDVIDKETYERELLLCQQFNKEKGGCGWGKCKTCGVLPLLYKLYKGRLLEGEDLIAFRKKVLGI